MKVTARCTHRLTTNSDPRVQFGITWRRHLIYQVTALISLSRLRGTRVVVWVFSVIIVKPARKLWYLWDSYVLSVHTLFTPIFFGEKVHVWLLQRPSHPFHTEAAVTQDFLYQPSCAWAPRVKEKAFQDIQTYTSSMAREELQYLLQQHDSIAHCYCKRASLEQTPWATSLTGAAISTEENCQTAGFNGASAVSVINKCYHDRKLIPVG